MLTRLFFSLLCILMAIGAFAQQTDSVKQETPSKKWYESFRIRGYVQVRYNELAQTNPDLKCEQCDKAWGGNAGFSLRRARIVLSGQISKQVYFYFQPDFASSGSGGLHFGQVRDAYVDVGVDKDNEYRFRVGQSKIPYGFENLQSSSNRLPLDRNDGMNSSLKNERDLGLFFYYAPKKIRERFAMLIRDGYKGSGDYGVFAFGAFNGQTANMPELNNQRHLVARLTYPFAIGSQIIEPGIQAYTGKYVVAPEKLSKGIKYKMDRNYLDERVAASFILYPRPFGIQAEYNIGRGPEFNKQTDSIEVSNLSGGYVTFSYMARVKNHIIFPFTRLQYYDGGKKHEQDARSYKVNEWELGVEWQPAKAFELVAMYTISSRRFEDYGRQNNFQKGSLIRLQAQLNF